MGINLGGIAWIEQGVNVNLADVSRSAITVRQGLKVVGGTGIV
jgi:hypothetical protein